jgi:2,4-dienoyl-CoA reductase-like NADH-dependent reductase (Old Yellow Enzyme family)/thioredoxin reductase
MGTFNKLFEPMKVGQFTVNNRVVMSPMITGFGEAAGYITNRHIDYYVARAKGGVGLIILECSAIEPIGRSKVGQLMLLDDSYIPPLRRLVEAVHQEGVKIVCQVHHAGRVSRPDVFPEGALAVGPSDVPFWGRRIKPLSFSEIREKVELYGAAARRAKAAGFDAVEVHGAHGYLPEAFMSPYTNKREDEYGGNYENRMRFTLEILKRVREEVGEDYPIFFRISGDEFVEGGLGIQENCVIAKTLVEHGVNVLDVSAGIKETGHMITPPMCVPPGCNADMSAEIKKGIKVPVIVDGRINDPALAERILQDGKADFIAMGRALLADPELPLKAREDRPEDIRKCIACLECTNFAEAVVCAVNAELGREREYSLRKVEKPKEIWVVGGGPAGLEVARVAALRGHRVTLFEKTTQLGGKLLLAAVPPYKEAVKDVVSYLSTQVRKLGVKVKLEVEVDAKRIKKGKPEVIILTTGGSPLIPHIPGLENGKTMTAEAILKGAPLASEKAILIAGGGMVGCETAEYLAQKGKKVTIVEMLPEIATDMPPRPKVMLLDRLQKLEVRVLKNTKLEEISGGKAVVTLADGKKSAVESNFIVLAMGSVPDDSLATSLKKAGIAFYSVGDCRTPSNILGAIRDAAKIAREI